MFIKTLDSLGFLITIYLHSYCNNYTGTIFGDLSQVCLLTLVPMSHRAPLVNEQLRCNLLDPYLSGVWITRPFPAVAESALVLTTPLGEWPL